MAISTNMNLLALANVDPYVLAENEEYMNEVQLAHFKVILEAWKQQILDESTKTISQMQTDNTNFPDPVDRASQEEELNLLLRSRDRERKLLKRINKTLAIIGSEDGEFGFCEDCGSDIGIRRLEARPIADLCVDCKTIAEDLEKHNLK
ncbi:MAG: RNA polymerase-binding protein DksA [Psittacicella sp.]